MYGFYHTVAATAITMTTAPNITKQSREDSNPNGDQLHRSRQYYSIAVAHALRSSLPALPSYCHASSWAETEHAESSQVQIA